tara:strand:+ start:2689 stop:3309 length:621 start_codon:yes stop_codon:yes gene_type:complete
MNNTKKILSIFVGKTFIKLILLIGISSSLFSQQKSNNINFIFANNGYGFGYEFEKFTKSNLSIGADLRFYDIRSDEYAVYDPFFNQARIIGEKNIIMLPLYFRLNYYPFEGKIANNFQPYFLFALGPMVSYDGDENIDSFSDRFSDAETQVNPGGSFGVGINFNTNTTNTLSLGLGYDFLKVKEPIHNKKDYGGAFLYLKYKFSRE